MFLLKIFVLENTLSYPYVWPFTLVHVGCMTEIREHDLRGYLI